MVFADRDDAGRRLAARLEHLRDEPVVVPGLPRGGVPVAFQVARLGPELVRPVLARGLTAGVLCGRSGTAEMVVAGARGHGGVAGRRARSRCWMFPR